MPKSKRTTPGRKRTPAKAENFVRLEGSERRTREGARRTGPADPKEIVNVTICVRRRPGAPALPTQDYWAKTPPGRRKYLSQQDFATKYGAAQADLDKVADFAQSNGLTVTSTNTAQRTVLVSGTVEQMNKAFGVDLGTYESATEKYRGREGAVYLPSEIAAVVEGVFGLDNRRMARRSSNGFTPTSPITPIQVAQDYNFPTGNAPHQTIGVFEFSDPVLGGCGFVQSDVTDYFTTNLGIGPGLIAPTPTAITVNGPGNSPGGEGDAEVMIDICVAAAVAQKAAINVYFATFDENGWVLAVKEAINPTHGETKPSVVSICWQYPEFESIGNLNWTAMAMNQVDTTLQEAAAAGITVITAAGDLGSDCGVGDGNAHVDYPYSDPWVTCCGGTEIGTQNGSYAEVTWPDTGGGISANFPLPAWQQGIGVLPSVNPPHNTGRGIPDICGYANGYTIVLGGSAEGPFPGTSETAPLYAGLFALINEQLGESVGYLNPTLYALATDPATSGIFREIDDGVSNAQSGAPGYTAGPGPGWNACNGWGTIDGAALLNSLKAIYTRNFYFVVDKSTFGTDEVKDVIASGSAGTFYNCFWLVLEGFTPNGIAGATPTFASMSTFNSTNVMGMSISPDSTPIEYELGGPGTAYADTVQRIRFAYDIGFTTTSSFPANGSEQYYSLFATISIGGVPFSIEPETVFELVGGEDPYFTNVDSGNPNAVFYLSQDVRVFSVGNGDSPLPGAPTLTSGGPYTFIKDMIGFLNSTSTYTTPTSGPDPLNALPGQTGYETGDSSVTPLTTNSQQNYNFALARVRLQQNASLPPAQNVRVFFRLFVAQSCDTDFQPSTTYKSTLGTSGPDAGNPIFPLPSGTGLMDPSGESIQTIPFFATDANGTHDYDSTVPNGNIRNIQIPMGQDKVWAYYGCYLDVYNASNQSNFPGTHHCIVAQIAFDDAPIMNEDGVTESPGNSDKLAQRNLQITSSGNPSYPATHRIPQAFDMRPSNPVSPNVGLLLNYPDELMIDWGNTPVGSVASIYWPQIRASDIITLALNLYGTPTFTAVDANTIKCVVTGGVTYIPIPSATGVNFGGLFTVDLPSSVRVGQEFKIKVRRISSRQLPAGEVAEAQAAVSHDRNFLRNWRYVTGTFQITIPVGTDQALLPAEENTLAVLKWRGEHMSPSYRWFPVLERYIAYVSARVDGFGGNAANIQGSLSGVPAGRKWPKELQEYRGKVCEVVYDCFGDLRGFVLKECCSERFFGCCEKSIGELALRACRERLRVAVFSDANCGNRICEIRIYC